jgi:hypothetical protein
MDPIIDRCSLRKRKIGRERRDVLVFTTLVVHEIPPEIAEISTSREAFIYLQSEAEA